MLLVDLTSQKFGRLTVLRRAPSGKKGARWLCVCECGKEHTVATGNLKTGAVRSCGCLLRDVLSPNATTHGRSRTPEYSTWNTMFARCYNENHKSYASYGGRGIKVCERWNQFENFLADMGERPSPKHSLDRYPDPNGNYEPGNVRWATAREQANNRRSCRMISYRGKLLSVTEAAREAGKDPSIISLRLRKGWDPVAALDTPVRPQKRFGTSERYLKRLEKVRQIMESSK